MTVIDDPHSEVAPEELAIGQNPPEVRTKVPFAMTDSLHVPKERYYDREFFELENKQLWPHSWLMAARLEEIPYAGDYTEFEIVGNSIIIVRQQDGSVKALHNACRHRATELVKGCGRLPGGQIVCPFHGWRWNLDGSNSFVFMKDLFDPSTMKADDLRLRECKVEIWAGMVWINLDLDAPDFSEAMFPVQAILDSVGIGNMRTKWWKQVVLNANWKMTMEAFHEGYHVMQTHPQLLMGAGEEAATIRAGMVEYIAFRGGHGRAHTPPRPTTDWDLEVFIEANRLLANGQDAMALDRDVQVFEGLRNQVGDDKAPNDIADTVKALFDYAQAAGIPMAPMSELSYGSLVFMFPNYFMLSMYGNCLVYRMRPYDNDPEWVLFDIWSLTTYPVGQEPERAELMGVFDKGDVEHWGLIPRQDFSNIERQQRGLHSQSIEKLRFSPTLERITLNLHEELDRKLAEDR